MTSSLTLACAACGKPYHTRHRCNPDLSKMGDKRIEDYWHQLFRQPGVWAIEEMERIRDYWRNDG